MTIRFYKYQGTGNDFVMIDDRDNKYTDITEQQVKHLCDRRFGIGADGLIFLRNSDEYDFEMVYYNSDGRTSTMCGNGGRCLLRFASDLGIEGENYSFMAVDGVHFGVVDDEVVSLQMVDLKDIDNLGDDVLFMNTGSPHHVVFTDSLPADDFVAVAKSIRYSDKYAEEGVNVNYVKVTGNNLEMRTYERGVEDETYSCGTGVTAAALGADFLKKTKGDRLKIKTAGGNLELSFKAQREGYTDIWLTGPAEKVFKGKVKL
ncbi:diaminopimelate epimerase [Owenweeksia hongkongensis]|uniref:diaminopimelate epimerase n=1 Tax=Owenweeksia hongkongensis TaxID=253245 RepID=UPI003A93E54F